MPNYTVLSRNIFKACTPCAMHAFISSALAGETIKACFTLHAQLMQRHCDW